MAVGNYWLPLLKPALAWLVIGLQQAHWQAEQSRGLISHARLGELSGLTRDRVIRIMLGTENVLDLHKGDGPKRKSGKQDRSAELLAWFVLGIERGWRPEGGKSANRYYVLLNDPLTPALVAGLGDAMAMARDETTGWAARRVDVAIQVIGDLLRQDRAELIDRLGRLGRHRPRPDGPATVRAIAFEVFDLADDGTEDLQRVITLTAELSRHILQPNDAYLGTQYFRQEWVPCLGATRSWLVTAIRRHCYENQKTGEQRAEFSYRRDELARMLGVSGRTMRRHLGRGWEAALPFFPEFTLSRQAVEGRVLVKDEPLTESDRERIPQLRQEMVRTGRDSLTGQMNFFPALEDVSEADTADANGQKYTSLTDKSTHRPPESKRTKIHIARGQKYTSADDPGGQKYTSPGGQSGQKYTSCKALISTDSDSAPDQQHQPAADAATVAATPAADLSEPDHGRGSLSMQPPDRAGSLGKLRAEAHRPSPGRPGEPGQEAWRAELRAATRGRGRVAVLGRMQQVLLRTEPDYRRLGALVKLAGGGLDGALAVARAIEQMAAGEPLPADPLTEVERLLAENQSPGAEPAPSQSVDNAGASEQTVLACLRRLGIGEPKRSRLAALPQATQLGYLEAWVGWFEGQAEFGPGWVIVQIEAGEWPPEADPPAPTAKDAAPAGENGYADPVVEFIMGRYRAEIGDVTPAVEGLIREATGPEGDDLRDVVLWELAFRQAAANQVRKWSYVLATARKLRDEQDEERRREEDQRLREERLAKLAANAEKAAPGPGPSPAERRWQKVWQAALGELQLQMTKATFDTWVKHTWVIGYSEGTLAIGVQNGYARDWLENRLKPTVIRTLRGIVNDPIEEIEFCVPPPSPISG